MKQLEYKITIDASVEKVWNSMLDADTYEEWTGVSWPGSIYEGNWKQGEDIRFVSKDGGGILAHLTEIKHHKYVSAEHVAILGVGGEEDRSSDMAKSLIGTIESYTFDEKNGKTDLTVDLLIDPKWESMFNDGWPKALDKLKEISERK